MSASEQLPPGVVRIEGSTCPPKTLGLWRDYQHHGPAYGVGAGYSVDLTQLPQPQGNMSKNVSSWVNETDSNAKLIGKGKTRPLPAHTSLEEPSQFNDSVERVEWET